MTMQNNVSSAGDPRPLSGIRVMVTRPAVAACPHPNPLPAGEGTGAAAADPLAKRLREWGRGDRAAGDSDFAAPDWRPVDDALSRLPEYDWLVFSSANGVRAIMERWRELSERGGTALRLSHPTFPRLAAMGPGTAEELTRYGLQAELVPEQFRAESLAAALLEAEVEKGTGTFCRNGPTNLRSVPGASHKRCLSPFPLTGKRFLLARASRGRDVLAQRLTVAGAKVDEIVVYTSTDVEQPDATVAAMLRAGQVDWITVTSSAIARSLARLFGDDLLRAKLASISPITSGVLRDLGYEPAAEAVEYTLAGLTAAIAKGRWIA